MRTTLLVLVALILLLQPGLMAQDFDALLKAVDKVEANLKELVAKETTTPQQETQKLLAEMKQTEPAPGVESDNPVLAQMALEIQALKLELAELRAVYGALRQQTNETTTAQNDVVDLVQELATLRAEIDLLRREYQSSPQLASTEPIMAPTHDPVAVPGTEKTLGGIEWSGFFDVVGSARRAADDETQFGLGQAEIDLASQLSNRVAVEAAVAYNNETGNFELGAALVDIHLFSREEGERHTRSFGIDHTYVLAGQFDVPFGIDYHVYPSIERKLVTAPLVVDLTHGGWNDYGVQFGLEAAQANFVCYWVNGFESSLEVLDEAQTLATGEEVYEEINTSPADAFGTRLGITPFSWLEIGSSLAAGWNSSGRDEMILVGADIQLALNNLEIKGEYISHSLNRTIAEENNRGWYAQATYSVFSNAFVTTRYGSFKSEQQDWYGQGSVGLGYALADGVELRWESSIHENGEDNQNFVQLVAGF